MKKCTWKKEDPFESDRDFETGCGEKWSFIEDGIKENNISFCPFCGKTIEEYDEVKEIRPEKAGELWQDCFTKLIFFTYLEKNELRMIFRDGSGKSKIYANCRYDEMVHKEGAYTRLYPPVEDDSVEMIEQEKSVFDPDVLLKGKI